MFMCGESKSLCVYVFFIIIRRESMEPNQPTLQLGLIASTTYHNRFNFEIRVVPSALWLQIQALTCLTKKNLTKNAHEGRFRRHLRYHKGSQGGFKRFLYCYHSITSYHHPPLYYTFTFPIIPLKWLTISSIFASKLMC